MLPTTTTLIFLSSLLFGIGTCHLCMISPPQRGSMMGINKPGAPDCILLQSPCGGRSKGSTILELMAGSSFTVTLMKNLDHFNKASPGKFTVNIGKEGGSFKQLLSFPDNADPALTLYSYNVTMPQVHGDMVLQSVYTTNNAQAPPAFYQCSDVRIVPRHHYQSADKKTVITN